MSTDSNTCRLEALALLLQPFANYIRRTDSTPPMVSITDVLDDLKCLGRMSALDQLYRLIVHDEIDPRWIRRYRFPQDTMDTPVTTIENAFKIVDIVHATRDEKCRTRDVLRLVGQATDAASPTPRPQQQRTAPAPGAGRGQPHMVAGRGSGPQPPVRNV